MDARRPVVVGDPEWMVVACRLHKRYFDNSYKACEIGNFAPKFAPPPKIEPRIWLDD